MADVEQLIAAWLRDRYSDDVPLGQVRVVTSTPADLQEIPRTIKVLRAGGPMTLKVDQPRIVLDFFATKTSDLSAREAARAFALAVDHDMRMALPHQAIADGVFVTRVVCSSRPSYVPDNNTRLGHYAGTYQPTVAGN